MVHGQEFNSWLRWLRSYRWITLLAWMLLGLSVALWLPGCTAGQQPTTSGDRPSVVSTSTILTDLAQTIAGDTIQLTGILQPGADPHVYEPVPADSKTLETANLILYNGYDLEPSLIKLVNSVGTNAQKLAVGEVVPALQLTEEGKQVPDPHVWGSAKNAISMANAIRDALTELVPTQRDRLTQNALKFAQDLTQLDRWIREQIQTIPANQRKLVTMHDAFQYYSKEYGIPIVGTLIGISTEEQPSAQTVQKLVESIKATGVPTIFAETTINPALLQTVAQEAGVKLAAKPLYSDSLGAPGSDGETYIKMMVANTTAIVEALGGKVTPFPTPSPA
jgi:manganese/iron transport system substrate-binding protein